LIGRASIQIGQVWAGNKVDQKRITNSKDLRKLRTMLPDPVARSNFLNDQGDLESAMLRTGKAVYRLSWKL
jgi:hypothetical protein